VNDIEEGRPGRPAPRPARRRAGNRHAVARLVLSALTITLLGAPATAAAAGTAVRSGGAGYRVRHASVVTSTVHVTVPARRALTDTGIALRAGASVVLSASGSVHFGGGQITRLGPAGIAWGPSCTAIAHGQARNSPWPAPGLRCWSLIGKVGAGGPFEVGTGTSFRVRTAGELSLGVNDNFLPDNFGTFAVTVTVSSVVAPAVPAAPPSHKAKATTSSTGLIVVAVVVAAVLLLALWLVAARRRRRPEPEDSPEVASPESVVVDTPAADAWPPAPVPEPEPEVVFAPPEADSIDVNIFEVEFSNGLTLRIGYNHFPEGTPLRWRVTQNRTLAATGDFVAKGGGSTNHVETIPLGVKLQGRDLLPDGADVDFEWSINGVPFRYSVRRDPNC
jgi:hypothetical protein